MGPALHGTARRLHHRPGQSIPPLNDIPRPSGKRLDPTGSNNRHRQLRLEFAAGTRTDQPLGKTLNSVEEVPEGLTSPDRRLYGRCEHHFFLENGISVDNAPDPSKDRGNSKQYSSRIPKKPDRLSINNPVILFFSSPPMTYRWHVPVRDSVSEMRNQ